VSSAVTEVVTIRGFLPQNSFGAFSARYFDRFPIKTSNELGTIRGFFPQNSLGAFSARYFDRFPIKTSTHSLYVL
jgi:hypothetical protein